MELFTFLKMGGTRSRIVLKGEAQGDDDKTIKRELLKGFDASKAQCHVAEDRQPIRRSPPATRTPPSPTSRPTRRARRPRKPCHES